MTATISWSRMLLAALALITAVGLQTSALSLLPAPGGGHPDLVLVLVVCVALVDGPNTGVVFGFTGGLVVDLLSQHPVGVVALVLAVLGYLVGSARDQLGEAWLVPVAITACAAVVTPVVAGLLLALVGDPRAGAESLLVSLPSSVLYDVALAAFISPAVEILTSRLDPDELRR